MISKERKDELKKTSIAAVGESLYGLSYKIDGRKRRLRCSQHESLLIDLETNFFFWNSKCERGDVIRFVQVCEKELNARNVSFSEAAKIVADFRGIAYVPSETVKSASMMEPKSMKGLDIPEKADVQNRIMPYLCEKRKLDRKLIEKLVHEKRIYQDKRGNVCFVGTDEKNRIQYIMSRGTGSSPFKSDASGSIVDVGFYVENDPKNRKIIITEGIIDALSYQTIDLMKGKVIDYNLLGAGGNEKVWQTFYFNFVKRRMKDRIEEIVIAVDNDQGGDKAWNCFIEKASRLCPDATVVRHIPREKDVNADLIELFEERLSSENTKMAVFEDEEELDL